MQDSTKEVTPAGAQEFEAIGHYVTVEYGDEKLEMIPPGAWRQSWQRKLKAGDMDAFMEDVMSPDSYERYLDLDPTNDELGELINAAGEAAGESVGKSSGRPTSSRSTRKR